MIGEQPELAPGEEHIYDSFCPLRTPTGKMKGTFRMQASRPARLIQINITPPHWFRQRTAR